MVVIVGLCLITLAGCSSSDEADATGSRSTDADNSVILFESDFGPALADDKGFTLYGFDDDSADVSSCVANCAVIFPPIPASTLMPGSGLDPGLIGSIARSDELGQQLTFAGRPLYRFSGDNLPGDAFGAGSGGRWWLVGATGERLTN